jgi:glycosyltransferase involved in cell wall biosynthesis
VNNKKIVIICHNYESEHTPRKPDPENRFFTYGFGGNMGRSLKKFCPDYEVEVWRLDGYVDRYYEGTHLGVKFRIFPSYHRPNIIDFSFKFLRELKKEVKKNDPVIVVLHIHYWLAYQIFAFFKKSRIVTTHHGDWSPFYRIHNTKGLRKIKARIDMFLEKRIHKNIDYIFMSEMNQLPYFKMANPDFKYFLWSTGVNFDHMLPISRQQARKELGWDPDKKYILYVGKLYKFKQADDLIRIWKDIKKTRPEIELVIIGNTPGDPWEEFYDLAVESGALILGRVLNKDLYKYYSAVDVYVLLALRSDYFGGTGVATLESLACNTPAVSYALRNYIGDNISEVGEVPDTVEKHKEAILKVIDHPENYKNMRESVRTLYSYESMYLRARKIFDELLENRPKK